MDLSFACGAAIGGVGTAMLLGRARLATLYDRADMPDQDRERFKTFVLPLVGWILVGAGALFIGIGVLNSVVPGRARELMQAIAATGSARHVGGGLCLLLGVLNAVSHVTGRPRPLKLGAMMQTYGPKVGRTLHLVVYTAAPIGYGIWLLSRP